MWTEKVLEHEPIMACDSHATHKETYYSILLHWNVNVKKN